MQGGPTEKNTSAPHRYLLAAARAPPGKEMKPQATTRAMPRIAAPPKPEDEPQHKGRADHRQVAIQVCKLRACLSDTRAACQTRAVEPDESGIKHYKSKRSARNCNTGRYGMPRPPRSAHMVIREFTLRPEACPRSTPRWQSD